MNTTIINIKTDPKVKIKAKRIAFDLGLNLSGVLNAYLKQFIRTKSVYFSLNEENPSPFLMQAMKESEKQRKSKDYYSFNNPREAIDFLKKQ
ncbi:MAG TPA: type II toxin-antitoxin system RelB/DinJ family antitoxin [Patescibacteria group bacterium]|nr:type II toxin-antitoxin system RelB/DinJ family antitoxin [Patescibacteria group bacterium]